MIKDLLVSFKDNIKSKTTNPFFGTLIIVWIFHNWRLLYSTFNFDEDTSLEDRLSFIAKYLDSQNLIPDLLTCIWITILVLVCTYILLNLSRLIVNFFEKIVTPKIYEITDKSSIVLKKEYDILKMERDRFEKRFEQERDSKLKLQDEYERLETRLQNALIVSPAKKENKESSDENKIKKLKALLDNKETLDAFREIVDVVLNKIYVPDSKSTNLMLRLNLVEKDTSDFNGHYKYKLTPDGIKLRDLLIDYDIPEKNE